MRIATFNILHGRSRLRTTWSTLDRLAACGARAGRRRARAAGGRPATSPARATADLTAVAAEAMGAVRHRFVAAISGTPGATWMAATGTRAARAPPPTASRCCPASRRQLAGGPAAPHPGAFPMCLPGPQSGDGRPRGAASGDGRAARHPAGAADGREHPPVVRARLEPRSAAPARPGPARLPRTAGADGRPQHDAAPPARWSGLRPLGAAPTFPADVPDRQLDHILTDDGTLRADRCGTGAADLGSSRALLSTFRGREAVVFWRARHLCGVDGAVRRAARCAAAAGAGGLRRPSRADRVEGDGLDDARSRRWPTRRRRHRCPGGGRPSGDRRAADGARARRRQQHTVRLRVAEPGWTMFMVSHFHYDPVWWNTQAAYTSLWTEDPPGRCPADQRLRFGGAPISKWPGANRNTSSCSPRSTTSSRTGTPTPRTAPTCAG